LEEANLSYQLKKTSTVFPAPLTQQHIKTEMFSLFLKNEPRVA